MEFEICLTGEENPVFGLECSGKVSPHSMVWSEPADAPNPTNQSSTPGTRQPRPFSGGVLGKGAEYIGPFGHAAFLFPRRIDLSLDGTR